MAVPHAVGDRIATGRTPVFRGNRRSGWAQGRWTAGPGGAGACRWRRRGRWRVGSAGGGAGTSRWRRRSTRHFVPVICSTQASWVVPARGEFRRVWRREVHVGADTRREAPPESGAQPHQHRNALVELVADPGRAVGGVWRDDEEGTGSSWRVVMVARGDRGPAVRLMSRMPVKRRAGAAEICRLASPQEQMARTPAGRRGRGANCSANVWCSKGAFWGHV